MMPTRKEILALHRYFYWAGTMRVLFRAELEKATREEEVKNAHFLAPYLPYHLAGMYTVVNGWKRLGLSDPEVDALLDADHLKLLKAFRHGVYHFHPAPAAPPRTPAGSVASRAPPSARNG